MDLSAVTFKRSPWIWLTYRKPGSRQKLYRKTRIRKDDPDHPRKVALEKNALEREILIESGQGIRDSGEDWGWVEPWFATKYRSKARTLAVYRAQWDSLSVFLAENKIPQPALLRREDCFDYSEWRTSQVKAKSGRNPSMNTAIGELKLLGMVMDEAVTRGFVAQNPCRKVGIARDETR